MVGGDVSANPGGGGGVGGVSRPRTGFLPLFFGSEAVGVVAVGNVGQSESECSEST